MTLELSRATRRPLRVTADTLEALRSLPSRKPAAPPEPEATVRWELVDIGRYRVCRGDVTYGFIDVVGAVLVALQGERYDRAVEIGQSLDFDEAVQALVSAGS
jgi:hypothetical protein